MGVLDWNVTAYTVAGTVQVEDLHKQYAEKLGAKYKVRLELNGHVKRTAAILSQ